MNIGEVLDSIESMSVEDIDGQIEVAKKRLSQLEMLRRIKTLEQVDGGSRRQRAATVAVNGAASTDESPGSASPAELVQNTDSAKREMPIHREIIAYLRAAGPSKIKVIEQQTGISYASLYNCLKLRTDLFAEERREGQLIFSLKSTD